MQQKAFLILSVSLLFMGCSNSGTDLSVSKDVQILTSSESDVPADDISIEFNGIIKKKSELSEDTLKWLDWYYTLSEENRNALSFIPKEFVGSGTIYTVETDESLPSSYLSALTAEELSETEELVRYYFTEGFDGVEEIRPADDDFPLYQNTGIEGEYDPGNIIIYMVLTGKDKTAGNPMRSISVARKSKSDIWKVINSGF